MTSEFLENVQLAQNNNTGNLGNNMNKYAIQLLFFLSLFLSMC